jgi:hypothetical protein
MTVRVLVADDLVRWSLLVALAPLPEVEVATGSAAIRGVILHRPAVVATDL